MARISSRPTVIDLTGDDSDLSLDEASISPFHSDLLKKFKVRSNAGTEKRQLFQDRDAPQRAEPSVPPSKEHVPADPLRLNHTTPSLPQSLNVRKERITPDLPSSTYSKPALQSNSNVGKGSAIADTSSSLTLKPPRLNLKPRFDGLSDAVEVAIATPNEYKKRNADEAFRDEQRPTSAHPRPSVQPASLSPFKIARISRPKEVEGRSGFDDLLSRAEASVNGRQDSPPDAPKIPRLSSPISKVFVPVRRQSTPFSAAGSLHQSIPSPKVFPSFGEQDTPPSATKSPSPPTLSPKVFSPPALQQASIGSSIRIVPIDEAVAPVPPPAIASLSNDRTTSYANSTTYSSSWQSRSDPQVSRPFQTPIGTPIIHPAQSSQFVDQNRNLPSQFNTPSARISHMYFDSSVLPKRQGNPFTEAELVLLIYLKEELNVSWPDLDRKMGRSTNCCATKYLRKEIGAKYRKPHLKYRERAAVIKTILAAMPNATIEKVFCLLSDFVDSGTIPPGCSALYSSILGTSSLDRIPDFPQKSASVSLSVSGVSAPVRERLRPGARTGEGDMNLKAMTRRVHDTPDVLSDEASVFSDEAYDSSSDVEFHALARKDYPDGAYVRRKKPYLGRNERRALASGVLSVNWEEENWSGLSLHLDPAEIELVALQQCADTVIRSNTSATTSLISAVKNASHTQIAEIARRAKLLPELQDRTKKSIQAILTDASMAELSQNPMRLRIAPDEGLPSGKQTSTRLLRRELGGAKAASRSIRQTAYDSLAPSRSWTGTSGDVGTVAWSPDGIHFAAGSMCIVDPSSMQYNRPNNLLFGNTHRQTLYELPEHHRPREKPKEGANSSHSMHVSQDPRLFFTVSMVDFSRDGSHMFSVGYDNFLRSYEVGGGRCNPKRAVNHGAEVDLLATSRHLDLLATGSRDIESGVRIYGASAEVELLTMFGSPKARAFLDKKVYPSALRWGTHSSVKNYLLAGFSSATGDETYVTAHGETCLWDVARQTPISVTPHAGNIFDVAWSPRSARFATACQAYSHSKSKGTHSVVRICSPLDMDTWSNRGLELECPARDINDVIFCPFDENYIAAGATDSKIYIWDLRRPDNLLQRLSHGQPLAELDPGMLQEDADCGARFCGWGENRERLLTGSSDGVVKMWDIHRSPRDAHIRDLASFNTGIMSGAFNHDFSSLLIGEVNGTINLLEIGADPPDLFKDLDSFHFEPAVVETNTNPATSTLDTLDKESGKYIGKRLLKAKRVQFRYMGGFPRKQAVQGKKYEGPYDSAPDAEELRDKAAVFQKSLMLEVFDDCGNVVRDTHGKAIYQPQCKLPQCCKPVVTTEEEAGESGRAVDRIPQALRDAATRDLTKSRTKEGKMVPGMLRCSYCGGLARPRVGDKEQEEVPLCERCGFSCFRCGEGARIDLGIEKIGCAGCGLEWRAGALGYEVERTYTSSGGEKGLRRDVPPVPHLVPFEHSLLSLEAGKTNEGGLENVGDLLYLVEDYYHGLWEDLPYSPL